MVLDAVPQLARGQEAALDQHLAEAGRRRVAALRLAELVEVDHARAGQALAEAVDHLVRRREDDLAPVEPHPLGVAALREVEQARLARSLEPGEGVLDCEARDVCGEGRRELPRLPLLALRRDALDLIERENLIEAAYCYRIVPLDEPPNSCLRACGETLDAIRLVPESVLR